MDILLVLLVCILTCAGQLCQKQFAEVWAAAPHSARGGRGVLWLGLALFFLGVGLIFWLFALRSMPVSIAYPLLSFNFVLVSLAAHFLFHERTSRRHWLGIAWIILGIFLLSANL